MTAGGPIRAVVRAVVCAAPGGPESLTVEAIPRPEPGEGEVLIEVAAAGVNFADGLIIAGKYQVKPPLPFSLHVGEKRGCASFR